MCILQVSFNEFQNVPSLIINTPSNPRGKLLNFALLQFYLTPRNLLEMWEKGLGNLSLSLLEYNEYLLSTTPFNPWLFFS